MSLFLFKPHVVGSKDNITTPDLIVDLVQVDGKQRSADALTTESYIQPEEGETGRAGFAVTAAGGGAIIGPVIVLSSGRICLSRKAWRMKDLDDHISDVRLNGEPMSGLRLPIDMIANAGGQGYDMPRGLQLIWTSPALMELAKLVDETRGRVLTHRVMMSNDHWNGNRPNARYSVGPTMKDVPHYL